MEKALTQLFVCAFMKLASSEKPIYFKLVRQQRQIGLEFHPFERILGIGGGSEGG